MNLPEPFNESLEAVRGDRRIRLAAVGAVIVVAIWGFGHWMTRPEWVPLVVSASGETVSAVSDRLGEDGIPYRLEKGGSEIRVPDEDLARARVALAAEGIPEGARPGFELFDQPSWGMTDFTQRVNYRRALEGELERTIARMRGVESAQVHLAIRESSPLRRQVEPGEASVVVRLTSGVRPDDGMVMGMASLVAGAVDGIDATSVRVLDSSGRLLSNGLDPSSPDLLVGRQLAVQREVERSLERKAEELLGRVAGPGNVSVRVSAALNFDRVDRTIQGFDPEERVALEEENSEIIPSEAEQGAASVSSRTRWEATRRLENYERGGVQVDRVSVAVLLGHRQDLDEEGNVEAVPWEDAQLAGMEALVRDGLGLSDDRGDGISVMNLPLLDGPGTGAPPPGISWIDRVGELWQPVFSVLALLVLALLGYRLIGAVRTGSAADGRVLAGATANGPRAGEPGRLERGEGASPDAGRPAEPAPEPIAAPNVHNAEMAARVVRAWMRD